MTVEKGAWDALRSAAETPLAELFKAEPDRLARLSFEEAGIYFDFSKTHLSAEIVKGFVALAEASGFAAKRDALFAGAIVNVSEGRPAEHSAERGHGAPESIARARGFHARMRAMIDAMSGDFQSVEGAFKSERAAFELLREETTLTLQNLALREQEYMGARAIVARATESASLAQYERIKAKFPMGAVAKVSQSTCSGCFMQVGPQVLVLLARGNALVRCPGCGRILFQDETSAASQ
jgi:hypothetical protein